MGYFPQSNSHYIENTGDEDLVLLEVLQAEAFTGEFFLLSSPTLYGSVMCR